MPLTIRHLRAPVVHQSLRPAPRSGTEARHAPHWTEEEDDRLRVLWASGETSGRIAQTLHRSKSACTSRAFYIGLGRRKEP